MILHDVRVHPSKDNLPREDQLAWKIATVAADRVAVEKEVTEMIVNRIIDNASVAIAAINRHSAVSARAMALGQCERMARPCSASYSASGLARIRRVGERHRSARTSYGTRRSLPPLLRIPATTSHLSSRWRRPWAIPAATWYAASPPVTRFRLTLVRADLAAQAPDRPHHPPLPSQAAGIGTLLRLPMETIYQAVQQAVHVSVTTRQSRKGMISSWKAYAPAHAGKLAVEAVDRAMRGEGAPSPIYEGEDSVIAWVLDGPRAHYQVPLPAPGEPKRAILSSFTKQHSASTSRRR